jgi:hypothetical protein
MLRHVVAGDVPDHRPHSMFGNEDISGDDSTAARGPHSRHIPDVFGDLAAIRPGHPRLDVGHGDDPRRSAVGLGDGSRDVRHYLQAGFQTAVTAGCGDAERASLLQRAEGFVANPLCRFGFGRVAIDERREIADPVKDCVGGVDPVRAR